VIDALELEVEALDESETSKRISQVVMSANGTTLRRRAIKSALRS
jgi:hypothetical protein